MVKQEDNRCLWGKQHRGEEEKDHYLIYRKTLPESFCCVLMTLGACPSPGDWSTARVDTDHCTEGPYLLKVPSEPL